MEVIHKGKWALTQEALDAFLAYLDADRARAGEKYETIRRKLISFFRARGCVEPEESADETIDRVIRRFAEGAIKDLMPFVLGVARHVASEVHKRCRPEALPVEPAALPRAEDGEGEERRWTCLERGLLRLERKDRELMLGYYRHEKSLKIENKRGMAKALGISTGALRVRACRVRGQLERWVAECMKLAAGR